MSEPTAGTTMAARRVSDEAPRNFRLSVTEGDEAGQRFEIDSDRALPFLVGTSAACDAILSDRRVSRRHLAIDHLGGRLRLRDLGSTNGTFVDGVSIVEAFVTGGEVVRVGSSALLVERGDASAVPSPPRASAFGHMVGASEVMQKLYPLCERLAASQVPVIIEGETGTGKEVLAESLHDQGPRKNGPFVVFDCTAVASNLLESALFGHERGAFTGAISTHTGVFEEAHGGTLLIDEIGDLDIALQAKLLRVLQRSEVRRVGGQRNIAIDVRVLAATRRDLDREIQAGRFRDDLFFRLAVARIELPPLRKREGDVALLAAHFWKALGGGPAGIDFETLRRLEDYGWPGNVRELHNVVARLIALGPLATIETQRGASSSDPDYLSEVLSLDLPLAPARQRVVDEFERRYVARIVDKHGGHVGQAAAAAGIARRYFQLLRAKARSG